MAFRVEVSPQAFEDLDSIAEHIAEDGSPEGTARWLDGMIGAIRTLEQMPGRCPLAPESEDLPTEVRLLLHGKRNRRYKVFFAIHSQTKTVRVFHIRHWARKPADAGEFEKLINDVEAAGPDDAVT